MSDADEPRGDQGATRWGGDDLTTVGAPSGDAPLVTRLGDFELIREIGRGGMGVVCPRIGQRVNAREYFDLAVARMNETYPRSPEFKLLREEAAELLGIQSPGS